MPFTSNSIQANGINQHYYRSGGDKPPLVLLHGFTDDGSCWFPATDTLEQDYDVILVDARGHGKSERIAGIGFSNESLADDVAGLITALGLNKPAVLGHSMGGFTALILAAHYPQLVGCLLMEDPPFSAPPPATPGEIAEGMRQWAANVRKMQGQSLPELRAAEHESSPHWSEAELIPWAESKHALDLEVFEERSPRPTWQSLMPKVECPILLIYGDKGTMVDDALAAESASLWKQGESVQIAGAGHCIRRDNLADYLTVVHQFLKAHYAG